eukprot:RCo000457
MSATLRLLPQRVGCTCACFDALCLRVGDGLKTGTCISWNFLQQRVCTAFFCRGSVVYSLAGPVRVSSTHPPVAFPFGVPDFSPFFFALIVVMDCGLAFVSAVFL